MGWDLGDTNCKFANVCSFSPRCTAKKKEDAECYRLDNRTFLQRLFSPINYWENIKNEYDYLENNNWKGDISNDRKTN